MAMLLVCFLGINTCFLVSSWISEQVLSKDSGVNVSPSLINISQSFASIIVAMVLLKVMDPSAPLLGKLTTVEMKLGFLQFGATFFTTYSTKFISYPMMVIFKSAKVLPVIILGILRGVYKFSYAKLSMAICLTMGLWLFSFKKIQNA
jgi:hypothetical protein